MSANINPLLQMLMQQQVGALAPPQAPQAPAAPDFSAQASAPVDAPAALQAAPEVPAAPDHTGNEDTLMAFLKGTLTRTSPTGEQPTAAQFDKMFKETHSPARSVLANMLFGMSDSLGGRKFQSLQEREYAKFQDDQKMKLHQQQMGQQDVAQKLQAAQIMGQQEIQTKATAAREAVAKLASGDKDKDRALKVAEFMETAKKNGWNHEQALANFQQKQYADRKTGDHVFDAAYTQAEAAARAANVDLATPDGQNKVMEDAGKRYHEIIEFTAKVKGQNAPARQAPNLAKIDDIDPDGNRKIIWANPKTGELVKPPLYLGFKTNAATLTAARSLEMASDKVGIALSEIQKNPNAIGSLTDAMSPDLRAAFGKLSPEQRTSRMFFNMSISDMLRGQSGLTVTEQERKFLTSGLPKYFEAPDKFFPAAAGFKVMLDAAAYKTRYNISLDMAGPMQAYMGAMETYAKAHGGSMSGFKLLSRDEFMDRAAQFHGKTLTKTEHNRMELK